MQTHHASAQPLTGDVVIVRTSDPDSPFSIQQVPGGAQFRASTHQNAVQLAHGFAELHALDSWYRDQHGCSLFESHRPPTVIAHDDQKVRLR